MTGEWVVTADRDGRRHYARANGQIIDGHGYGRLRWTVTSADGSYGMTDSFTEAKSWADRTETACIECGNDLATAGCSWCVDCMESA